MSGRRAGVPRLGLVALLAFAACLVAVGLGGREDGAEAARAKASPVPDGKLRAGASRLTVSHVVEAG